MLKYAKVFCFFPSTLSCFDVANPDSLLQLIPYAVICFRSQMPDIVVEAVRPKRTEFSLPSPISIKMSNQPSQLSPLMDGKPLASKIPKIKRENSFDKKPASAMRISNPQPKSESACCFGRSFSFMREKSIRR